MHALFEGTKVHTWEFTKVVVTHLKAKFGTMSYSRANEEILRREAIAFMTEWGARKTTIVQVEPIAVQLAMIPTSRDIFAKQIAASAAAYQRQTDYDAAWSSLDPRPSIWERLFGRKHVRRARKE